MKTDLTPGLLIKSNNELIMTELLIIKSLVIVHHDTETKSSEVLTLFSFSRWLEMLLISNEWSFTLNLSAAFICYIY